MARPIMVMQGMFDGRSMGGRWEEIEGKVNGKTSNSGSSGGLLGILCVGAGFWHSYNPPFLLLERFFHHMLSKFSCHFLTGIGGLDSP